MLKLFRKKIVSKIILWGLLILILPAFVMWGSASMSGRSKEKGPSYAGTIDNKKVSFEDFYGAITGVRSQVILNYFNQPKILDAVLNNKPLLAKIAWDRLIMLNEARRLGIKTSDKEVVQFIQTHPLFSRNGVFDDKFYAYILRNNIGLEPRAFEEITRENISMRKLTDIIAKDLKVSDNEVADEYRKGFSKIKIAYLTIKPEDFAKNVNLSETAARDYYEKNKGNIIAKSKLKGALPDREATFEEAKGDIENYLKQTETARLASQEAENIYAELTRRMDEKNESFEKSAMGFGYDVKQTPFFSGTDTLEQLDDAAVIAGAAAALKDFEVSKPVQIKNSFIIFEIVQRQPIDEEKFKKEKEEYAKKVRLMKSDAIMEKWLKEKEGNAPLAIKLEEIEKYYR